MPDAELPANADEAARQGDGIAQGRLRRASSLAGLTAQTAGEALALGMRSRLTGREDPEFHTRTAARYAELLGRSRGVLMKAGQMVSFMAGTPIFPEEFQSIYQTALTRLCCDAPAMSPELAQSVIERELGQPVESAFAEFDWTPIAAASIGQVHAARLGDGRAVAVKVQYPGVAQAIRADLRNAELLVTFLGLIGGMLGRRLQFDARGAADELGARITEELDYRLEAANQAEFAARYRGHPFIRVPQVVDRLSTERVLTQDLVEGRRWHDALSAPQELRDRWGEAIFRFTFGSFLRFGLVNADPHPGNYLFHEDGGVSFLDFGCVRRYSPRQVEACKAVMRASCLREDPLGTWRAGIEANFWGASDAITPEEAFTFWRSPWELLWGEQPFAVTPERVAVWNEHFSPNGPSGNVIRNVSASPEYTVMARIEIGALSVVGQLRSTGYWRAMLSDFLEGETSAAAG